MEVSSSTTFLFFPFLSLSTGLNPKINKKKTCCCIESSTRQLLADPESKKKLPVFQKGQVRFFFDEKEHGIGVPFPLLPRSLFPLPPNR